MPNHYSYEIDCEREIEQMDFFLQGNRAIHDPEFTFKVLILVKINGHKKFLKTFMAWYHYKDLEYNKHFADLIMKQFASNHNITELYDCCYSYNIQPGDTMEMIFSDHAKEMFDFLKEHATKLISFL